MDARFRHVTARLMGPLTVPVTTVGVGVFVLATIAAHLAHPELSPLVEPVSLYAHGAGGWLMATAFIAIGLTGLWISAVATGLTRAGRACLALWSAGALAGAAFPIDASDAPATISGMIHQLAGFNFVVVIAAALLFGRSFRRRLPDTWARRVGSSAWLLTASGILLVVFIGPVTQPPRRRSRPAKLLGCTPHLATGGLAGDRGPRPFAEGSPGTARRTAQLVAWRSSSPRLDG